MWFHLHCSLLGSLMEPSPDWLCPPQLMLCVEGLEEEPFNYEATPETDELLLLASQAVEFDESSDIPPVVKQVEPPATTPPPEDVDRDSIDDLFIAVSQQLDDYELEGVREATGSSEKQRKFGRFTAPVTATEVKMARKCGVPQKTRDQTSWSCRVWAAWARQRKKLPAADLLEKDNELCEDISKMAVSSMQFWLPKFVLEVEHRTLLCKLSILVIYMACYNVVGHQLVGHFLHCYYCV